MTPENYNAIHELKHAANKLDVDSFQNLVQNSADAAPRSMLSNFHKAHKQRAKIKSPHRMYTASVEPQKPVEKIIETKKLEIGAGARISQEIGVDPNSIDFWQPEPAGMVYVNFVGPETLQKILDSGKRQDQQEGPLNGLKVGN